MRIRTRYKEYPEYRHKFFYHNLISGIMPKLNFDYGISLGIGAGILLPLYSKSSKNNHEVNHGLAGYYYDHIKEFDFEKISYMYKVPIMPYIKLNLEKNFYMSELWAFKIGANLVYNFGMEFDMDKLKSGSYKYGYDKYKFSSLSFELFLVSVLDALNKVLVLNYNVLPPNKIPRRNVGLFFVYCYCADF